MATAKLSSLRFVGYSANGFSRFTAGAALTLSIDNDFTLRNNGDTFDIFKLFDSGAVTLGKTTTATTINGFIDVPAQAAPAQSAPDFSRLYYDHAAGALLVSIDGDPFTPILTGSAVLNTDVITYIQPQAAIGHSGVYTLEFDAGSHWTTLTRTPSVANDGFIVTVPNEEFRTTANKGKRITSFDVVYSIAVNDLDDFSVVLYSVLPPVHGAAQTTALIAFTYDTAHANAGGGVTGRGAVNNHTMHCTVGGGGVWLNNNDGLFLEAAIDADAAGTADFKFFGLKLNYTSNED
jgi:hypothetical protein